LNARQKVEDTNGQVAIGESYIFMEENKKDNLEKYKESLKGETNIPKESLKREKNAPQDPLIDALRAEGDKLLEADKKKSPKKTESKVLETALGEMSANPYVKARFKVLKTFPEWRRREVEEMEKTGNINNPHYDDFVKQVAKLGDSLS